MPRLTLCALALVAFTACAAKEAPAENWADHLEITAKAVAGKSGTLEVRFQATEGWFVNTAYPGTTVSFEAPEGVTLAHKELKKADGRFEGQKEDKAAAVVFSTGLQAQEAPEAPIKGAYKIVVCSASTCSPPFKGTFEAKIAPEGA